MTCGQVPLTSGTGAIVVASRQARLVWASLPLSDAFTELGGVPSYPPAPQPRRLPGRSCCHGRSGAKAHLKLEETQQMTRTTTIRNARAELDAIAVGLGEDELQVLVFVAGRLAAGRERYGALHLSEDPRDWYRERSEELADSLVYTACAEIARVCKLTKAQGSTANQ